VELLRVHAQKEGGEREHIKNYRQVKGRVRDKRVDLETRGRIEGGTFLKEGKLPNRVDRHGAAVESF